MPVDSKDYSVQVGNGIALSASHEAPAFYNDTGQTLTLVSAVYIPETAITADASNYYTLAIHRVTAAGAHTVVMASKSLLSVAVTAYVPVALTLVNAYKDVEPGQSVNVVATKTASAPNLDATGRWVLLFKGQA